MGHTIDIEGFRVSLVPEVRGDGTNAEGSTVVSLNNGERQTDDHEVGVVVAVLGPLASVAELPEDSHRATEQREDDGEDTTGVRDGELIGCDSDSDSAPGGHGWCSEGASLGFGVKNAGVGFGEQDEKSRSQETCHDRADGLGQPLLVWSGAKQEADTEVSHQIGGLVSTNVGDSTTEQVETLSIGRGPALRFGSTTKYDLRGLGRRGKRCDY